MSATSSTGRRALWQHPFGELFDEPSRTPPALVNVLWRELGRDADAVDYLGRIATALAKVDSPFLAKLKSAARQSDGRIALVHDRLEGEDLGTALSRGAFSVERAVAVLRQLCRGLARAHAIGINHRALGPASVVLLSNGAHPDAVRIIDFGIAGVLGDAETKASPLLPLTPERVLGFGTHTSEDVYLVGCLGYWMLAGAPPFVDEDTEALRRRHAIEDVPPLRSIAKTVPTQLARVIEDALVKDPDERTLDLSAFESALVRAQRDLGISTPWDDDIEALSERARVDGECPATSGVFQSVSGRTGKRTPSGSYRPLSAVDHAANRASGPSVVAAGPAAAAAAQAGGATKMPTNGVDRMPRPKPTPGAGKMPRPRPITKVVPAAAASEASAPESTPPTVPAAAVPARPLTIAPTPVETTPVEAKPVEAKPIAAKPVEAKPVVVAKPAVAKPVLAKPAEARPVAAKPVEAKPVAKPVEAKPIVAKPVEAKPIVAKPVEAKPVAVKPSEATPSEAKPIDAKASPAKPRSPTFVRIPPPPRAKRPLTPVFQAGAEPIVLAKPQPEPTPSAATSAVGLSLEAIDALAAGLNLDEPAPTPVAPPAEPPPVVAPPTEPTTEPAPVADSAPIVASAPALVEAPLAALDLPRRDPTPSQSMTIVERRPAWLWPAVAVAGIVAAVSIAFAMQGSPSSDAPASTTPVASAPVPSPTVPPTPASPVAVASPPPVASPVPVAAPVADPPEPTPTITPEPKAAPRETAVDPVRHHLARAKEARKKGKRDEAIAAYQSVLRHDSRNRTALRELSRMHFDAGNYDAAVRYGKQLVSVSTSSAADRVALGDAYFKLGRTADAKAQYQKAAAMGDATGKKRLAKLGG